MAKVPPIERSPPFINLWVRALRSCFIEPFSISSSWTLLQVSSLGRWFDPSAIDRWKWFYSDSEDRIFCRTQWGWDTFVHSTRGKYCLSAFTVATRPISATNMITLSRRNTPIGPERPSPWDPVPPDLNPTEYNPMDNPPPCINSFFEAVVQTLRALLDKIKLPTNGGAAVTQAISPGTASAVSDGSYDDSRRAGS